MITIALGIVVLLVAILLDSKFFQFIMKPEYQVILGTIVVAIVLFDNALSGLLFGLAVIAMYTRVIAKKYGINLDLISIYDKNSPNNMRNGDAMRKLVTGVPYVTPTNLLDAQNNIISVDSYNNTYVGLKDKHGSPIYSAEGTDKEGPTDVQGYDNGIHTGSAVKY